MGWTFYHREPGQSDREHFAKDLRASYEILDCTTIKNTWYAAVRDNGTGEVFALVYLIQRCRGDYNFGVKEMDETVGPVQSECPERILDLLTPTEFEWANEWRARCRANAAAKAATPKVKPGDTVKFSEVLRFGSGWESDTFELIERSTFRIPGGIRVRIPSWKSRPFELVNA